MPGMQGRVVSAVQRPVPLQLVGTVTPASELRPDPVQAQVDAERACGVATAMTHLLAGNPGRARYELTRSVMRQVRIAGGGTIPIEPRCPCGGRCFGGAR